MALPSSSATSAASTATTTASLDGRTDRLSFDESRGRAWEDLLHRFLSRGYSDRDISWIFTPNYSDRDSFWKEPQYYPDHDIRRGWGRRGYPQCQRVRKGDTGSQEKARVRRPSWQKFAMWALCSSRSLRAVSRQRSWRRPFALPTAWGSILNFGNGGNLCVWQCSGKSRENVIALGS